MFVRIREHLFRRCKQTQTETETQECMKTYLPTYLLTYHAHSNHTQMHERGRTRTLYTVPLIFSGARHGWGHTSEWENKLAWVQLQHDIGSCRMQVAARPCNAMQWQWEGFCAKRWSWQFWTVFHFSGHQLRFAQARITTLTNTLLTHHCTCACPAEVWKHT